MKRMTLQPSDLGQVNRAIVLSFIRHHKHISRVELAKKTKMAGPTISRIIQDLIAEGLVSEGGVGESIGGRRPILLNFRPEGRVIVGLDIRPQLVHGIVCNLDGDILFAEDAPMGGDMNADEIIDLLIKHAEGLLRKSKVDQRDLAGIGLSIPGLIDHYTQTIRYSPPIGWRNFPIRQPLSSHFGVPVLIGNTVEVMTLAEKYMGSETAQRSDHLAYLYFGPGVGAGLINNGTLFRGSRYSGLEFGHTTIDMNGPKCSRCGNYGCMEMFTSEKALIRKANEQLRAKGLPEIDSVGALARLQGADKQAIVPVLQEMALYIGIGIANMLNLFNPQTIVIGGWPCELADPVFEQARQIALGRCMEGMGEGLQLLASSMGERSVVLGAASLVIEKFFKGELPSMMRERS